MSVVGAAADQALFDFETRCSLACEKRYDFLDFGHDFVADGIELAAKIEQRNGAGG